MYVCMYVCMYVRTYVYMWVFVCIGKYACIHACMYVRMYALCMFVCDCVHCHFQIGFNKLKKNWHAYAVKPGNNLERLQFQNVSWVRVLVRTISVIQKLSTIEEQTRNEIKIIFSSEKIVETKTKYTNTLLGLNPCIIYVFCTLKVIIEDHR
jgi:hypothetical protein